MSSIGETETNRQLHQHYHHQQHHRQQHRQPLDHQNQTTLSETTTSKQQQQQQQQEEQSRRRSQRLRGKSCVNYNIEELIHRQDYKVFGGRTKSNQISQDEREMLSKIKSSSNTNVAGESRGSVVTSLSSHTTTTNHSESDNEETDAIEANDSNNNNNNNVNNNQSSKKSQDELMDIVEVSRKRRLSRDSADSLTNFIRWSFSHFDHPVAQARNNNIKNNEFSNFKDSNGQQTEYNNDNNNNNSSGKANLTRSGSEPELILDEEDDWTSLSQAKHTRQAEHSHQQHLLRHHSKLVSAAMGAAGSCGGSSAANLALLRQDQRSMLSSEAMNLESGGLERANKRLRSHLYSPDSKFSSLAGAQSSGGGGRKGSGYLGNVVERLHQQQQQQQQQQRMSQHTPKIEQDPDDSASNAGLSFHLQQFLQQQTSLEDLCSSVGLDDSNQLVLAAAIHRALVDSVDNSGQPSGSAAAASAAATTDSKSSASSVGSSSGVSSSTAASTNKSHQMNTSGANLHLVDSLTRRNRIHNTRATLSGLGAAAVLASQQQQQSASQQSANQRQQSAILNMSNRVQQQRHAQAAAALSALASAGSHYSSNNNNNNNHQHLHHQPQQLTATGNNSSSMDVGGGGGGGGATAMAVGAGASGPIVDFECDTCGSSFDDRHRLMQHQSIHLELKKDWFTETPVDEVMKIFNRRRGEFLCNTCNLRFEATFDYDKHNHSIHGQRPYCCQFCGNGTRTFRFWRQYLNHLYDHRYVFSCTIDDCDFTVNRRDSLRFHIFRFHLNCQLPQHQQHIRSSHNQHHHSHNNNNNNNNMLLNESKWSALEDDEDNDEMNVGE